MLRFVGVSTDESKAAIPQTRMITGFRSSGGAAAILLDCERTRVPWGKRFEYARALGHLCLDPLRGNALGAASSPFASTLRRKRSGAFAAELLLPEAALKEATAGTLDRGADPKVFGHLLQTFGVGARTGAQQLWNHGLLSSLDVRNDLIDDFSAHPIS